MPAATFTRATSTAIDLSRLPAPDVVETLEFEAILAGVKADFQARFPEFTANLESDPVTKLLEVFAYRELLLRARVNSAARSVMIAYASDADLDNLALLFGVIRQEIAPANEQTGDPAVFEDDEALRRRVLLAPDSFSVAGPASAYVFHALTADADVLDASAISPEPGEVTVSILSRTGDGTAPAALINIVADLLEGDEVRPLTDRVTVRGASIVDFAITASLTLYPGPDQQLILETAEASLAQLIESNRRLGRDVTLSAIGAALHVAGVHSVNITDPVASIIVDQTQAANLTAQTITIAGFDE